MRCAETQQLHLTADESSCSGNHVDASDGPMDAYNIGNNAKPPKDDAENVRKCLNDLRM